MLLAILKERLDGRLLILLGASLMLTHVQVRESLDESWHFLVAGFDDVQAPNDCFQIAEVLFLLLHLADVHQCCQSQL